MLMICDFWLCCVDLYLCVTIKLAFIFVYILVSCLSDVTATTRYLFVNKLCSILPKHINYKIVFEYVVYLVRIIVSLVVVVE